MKRSLISLAVIAASGQAHVIAPADKIDYIKKIRGRDDLNPVSLADRKPRDVRPIHIGGDESYIKAAKKPFNIDHGGGYAGIKGNDGKRDWIHDVASVTQWPSTGGDKSHIKAGGGMRLNDERFSGSTETLAIPTSHGPAEAAPWITAQHHKPVHAAALA